jgi:hypothetical protein
MKDISITLVAAFVNEKIFIQNKKCHMNGRRQQQCSDICCANPFKKSPLC